jgi:carbon starvation protein CstA
MKEVFNVIAVIGLVFLPFGILEGMWSEPSLRGIARSFDGSRTMWIIFGSYYLILVVYFLVKSRSNKT